MSTRIDKGTFVPLLSGVQGYSSSDIVVTLHNVVGKTSERIQVRLQPAKLVANAGEGHSRDDTTSCIWHLPSDLTHEVLSQ